MTKTFKVTPYSYEKTKPYWGIFTQNFGQTKHRFKTKSEAEKFLSKPAYCVVPKGETNPQNVTCYQNKKKAQIKSKKIGGDVRESPTSFWLETGAKVKRGM